jgi:hypothetical protein
MINSLDTWGIFVSAIQHVFKLFLFKKYLINNLLEVF